MGRKAGVFVAIEGIDAAGKKTQTAVLRSWLRSSGFTTRTMSFPVYGTTIGREIRKFLDGRALYPPQVRAMLYAANRWEKKDALEEALSESDVLIVNRYLGSNLAYGVSSGLGFDWLLGLESGLPRPDLVLVLDASPAKAATRRKHNKDFYEKDIALQRKARRAYLKLAAMLKWTVIDADAGVEDTGRAVQSAVMKVLSGAKRDRSG